MTIDGNEVNPPAIDLANAYGAFLCAPHAYIVAISELSHMRGEFIVDDVSAKRSRANVGKSKRLAVGTVIAAGCLTDLRPGDWVLVDPKFAKKVRGIESGPFQYPGDVWLFGISSPRIGESVIVETKHTCYAVIGSQTLHPGPRGREKGFAYFQCPALASSNLKVIDTYGRNKRGRVVPQGRVAVHLEEKDSPYSSIEVTDRFLDRCDRGLVIGASNECINFEEDTGLNVWPGCTVIYQRRGIIEIYPEGDKHTAYLPKRAIFALCHPPEEI